MKFIKFILSKGKDITLPEDKALKILNDPNQQIFKINDTDGKWTGKTINKAFLIGTEPDYEAEKDWVRDNTVQLPEPEEVISEEEQLRIEEEKRLIAEKMKRL